MKIDVVVKTKLNNRGAASTHVSEIWGRLAKKHAVRLWLPHQRRGELPAELRGVELRLTRREAPKTLPLELKAIGAALYEAELLARMLVELRRDRPDVIYLRQAWSIAPFIVGRTLGIPVALEVNGPELENTEAEHTVKPLTRRGLERLLDFQFRSASLILPVTANLKELVEARSGARTARLRVVPNGANLALFRPRPEPEARAALGLSLDGPRIGWVGAVHPAQDIDLLLRATAEVMGRRPDLRLLMVCGNPDNHLHEMIEALGIRERVLVSSLPREEVPGYVSACSFCVAAFRAAAPNAVSGLSPLKIYEYLACERPVIATRFPGLEFIEDESLGYLYRAGDHEGLVGAIEAALSCPDLAEKGKRGRSYVERHHSWEAIAGEVESALAELSDSRRGHRHASTRSTERHDGVGPAAVRPRGPWAR